MKIRSGYLLSLIVISLMILLQPTQTIQVQAETLDKWWDDTWPYRLQVTVEDSGTAAASINFSNAFEVLGLEDALLDVRSLRVVPYIDGIPGDPVPYEETYSSLLTDADTLNRDPDSQEPYWKEEELFTLNLDQVRFTQGTGSVHAHFEYEQDACTRPGFNYYFNDTAARDWSDYEVLIYDVWPEVNDSAVDQSPDIFQFELEGLQECPKDRINGPALVMNEWNYVSVSLKPFGDCSNPDASSLENIHFLAELNLLSLNPGNYGEGDEFDVWLDDFRLVDQDGDGEIRWETVAEADKYYIYFDTLNHEGHSLLETLNIGAGEAETTVGAVEAGGYFHQISDSETGDLVIWHAPIEEKILRTNTAPVSFQPLRVYAARGEMEAFQIVVNSPEERTLSVAISDLSNGNVVISANLVDLFRVDYVTITKISDIYGRLSAWPDPLYPVSLGDTVTFKAEKNQPLWFRLRVPTDAQAGLYSGVISVGAATIPISLEVWNFALPQDYYLDVEFGFDWDAVLETYGATKNGVKEKCYSQVKEAIDAALEDYRVVPLSEDNSELPDDVLLYSLTNYEVVTAHTQQVNSSIPVWWEFVYTDQPPFPNPAVIDRTGLDARILPWMAWLDRVDGIYYAQSADWEPDPWSAIFSNGKCNGDGFFFYPPQDDTLGFDPCDPASNRMIPSIRLELLREGLEDYGYLWLLNGQAPVIDIDNTSDTWARLFIGSRSSFLRIPTKIDTIRAQIAELLKEKQTTNDYYFPLHMY